MKNEESTQRKKEMLEYNINYPAEPLETDLQLAKVGRDLTYLAAQNKLPPITGLEEEAIKLIEILVRSRRPNPIILGAAGVGKTSLVEKLAQIIIERGSTLPPKVGACKIVEMSYVALAGMQGGNWQDYISNITRAFKEASENPIILFIDEIHQLWAFPITFSQVIPMLERGDVRIIGATTLMEYHKFLESDRALSRRFEAIHLEEPDKKRMIEILKNALPTYYRDYGISCTRKMLTDIYELTELYVHNTPQPGASLDVLETSIIKQSIEAGLDQSSSSNRLDFETVKKTIAEKSKIPIRQIEDLSKKLPHLERRVKRVVFGQDHVVKIVIDRIIVAKARLDFRPERPDGVFLFVGPPGVGKTYLAGILAQEITGSRDNLINLDMNMFAYADSVKKFTRAARSDTDASYGNVPLLEMIRKRPHGVLLLDEIEKAHPLVWYQFLKIFDEGYVQDELGITTDFSNMTIIMTSNLGYKGGKPKRAIGLRTGQEKAKAELAKEYAQKIISDYFPREFLNRIDSILFFNPLDKETFEKIILAEMKKYSRQLKKKVSITDEAVTLLLQRITRTTASARDLMGLLNTAIASKILDYKTRGAAKRWEHTREIKIDADANEFFIRLSQ